MRSSVLLMIVVVGVGLVVAVTGPCAGDDSERDRTAEIAHFVPDPIPSDARNVTAWPDDGDAADADGGGSRLVLGRPDGDGFVGVVRVLVASRREGRDPRSYTDAAKVAVGDADGYMHDNPLVGAYVSWLIGPWHATVAGPAGAGDLVLRVARSVEISNDGEADVAAKPSGYVEVASFGWTGDEPRASWSLTLGAGDASRLLPSISGSLVPVGATAWLFAAGDRLARVSVRGHEAVLAERSTRHPGEGSDTVLRFLTWLERPDLSITVHGVVDAEDLARFAETLREVDEAQFKALQRGSASPSTLPADGP